MIEITAKQLYDMYEYLEEELKNKKVAQFLEEDDKLIGFVRSEEGDWKPTTDLIIKA